MPKLPSQENKIICGDCSVVMSGMKTNVVDLIFADPPFNLNVKYGPNTNDNKKEQDYYFWTEIWMGKCARVLKMDGNFLIAISAKHQHKIRVIAEMFNLHWQDTIIWHYTFGPNQRKRLTPSWVAIHWFTKQPGIISKFNPEPIRVPSQRQLKYKDKRANRSGKVPDNLWILSPREEEVCLPNQNVMLESRVAGTFNERVEHPCQMPVPLMERIVAMASNPRDLVLDPFCGSGSTLIASKNLSRRYIGIDNNEDFIKLCRGRVK